MIASYNNNFITNLFDVQKKVMAEFVKKSIRKSKVE